MMDTIYDDIIYQYTREEAINDGVLIQIPADISINTGILYPVAISDHLWGYINPGPSDLQEMPGQSETIRLIHLLSSFRKAVISSKGQSSRIKFGISFQIMQSIGPKRIQKPETITVVAVCGPGDEGEPVITLMLPEDD